jgi:cysteinyl-tRNA synthetase
MNNLHLYQHKESKKISFEPLVPGKVNMYVCGPTPYDSAHLGHGRAAVVFDLLYRVLRYIEKYDVNYVRNFTDVDDKIIARAAENGEQPLELSERFSQEYLRDVFDLATLEPEHQPKVSTNIDAIVEIVGTLIDKGYAYESDGNVYFSIQSFDEYGKLSGRDTDSMLAGQRVEVDFRKRDPLDFALWKEAKEGEISWDSPWGPGRPGWHIECSAMSQKYAATTLDIHGGGRDLLFPHHENEVAQSECAHGQTYARYWVHNGFVNVGSEKMAKSLKNFVTIRDALDRFPNATVRYFVLASHYRSILDFSWKALAEALKSTDRFYALRAQIDTLIEDATEDAHIPELEELREHTIEQMRNALLDDLNTPEALGALHNFTTEVNKWLDGNKKAKTRRKYKATWTTLKGFWDTVTEWTGLVAESPSEYNSELCQKGAKVLGIDPEQIQYKLDERNKARAAKDFEKSDSIRDELLEQGVLIQDTVDGSTWSLNADKIAEAVEAD